MSPVTGLWNHFSQVNPFAPFRRTLSCALMETWCVTGGGSGLFSTCFSFQSQLLRKSLDEDLLCKDQEQLGGGTVWGSVERFLNCTALIADEVQTLSASRGISLILLSSIIFYNVHRETAPLTLI